MLKFLPLDDKSIKKIQKYTKNSSYRVCDISAGVLYMWNDIFNVSYSVYNKTLILKSNFKNSFSAFFMPVGVDVDGALKQIEVYAQKTHTPLKFMCVEERWLEFLKSRYNDNIKSEYNRDFSDYLYDYQSLKTLVGKKFSGQRNHINGFKKLYPNYKFKKLTAKHKDKIMAFLKEYKKEHVGGNRIEKAEFKNTLKLVNNLNLLNFVGGYMEINKKMCSFTIGEYVGETLIIHIEKALKNYKGIYPATFNEFLKASEKEGVTLINREDDSGDLGLRTSKTQYQPIELLHKHFVSVNPPFNVRAYPYLKGKKIILNKITESDKKDYYKLYVNKSLNKYWGYDYKKDIKNPTIDSFYELQKNDFKAKDNMCLAIRKSKNSNLIGEIVLHNFTYDGEVEIGVRLFKKYHNQTLGTDALKTAINYVVKTLKKRPIAKCYLKNLSSLKSLQNSGFIVKNEDKKFYYLEFLS